jgi:hypothetical protein
VQVTWWEYAELLEHLENRPDIWRNAGEGLWARVFPPDGEIAFAVQFLPPTESGPYRMYTVAPSPMTWDPADIDDYLQNLMFYWTSYSSRVEAAKLLQSELKLDPETSWLMAIALIRAYIEPQEDPDRQAPPPRVQHLWSDIPSSVNWKDCQGVVQTNDATVSITKHHEMLRVQIDVSTTNTPNGRHRFCLRGFVRPLGYSIDQFVRHMDKRQEEIVTPDPDLTMQPELLPAEEEVNTDAGC